VLKELSDLHFPDADKIVLVQDNLSTQHDRLALHGLPPRPKRVANRFEWHYAPKHGSWLDMAESELAVLTNQCLSRDRGAPFPDCGICDSYKPKLFGLLFG
jgi:hypothetical protein